MQNKRILGIDPGFDRLGLAVIEKETKDTYIHSECFQTKKTDTNRLQLIYNRLIEILDIYKPESVAIEELFFSTNERTALKVGEARGVLLLACSQRNIPVFEYNPGTIKLAVTGYGKSDKQAVSMMVSKLLKLPHRAMLDDELDACAIALTHSAHSRVEIHTKQTEGVAKRK